MNDRRSAAILAAIAGVALILWYRRRSETERQAIVSGPVPTPGGEATGGKEASGGTGTPLDRLFAFAAALGLTVTSRTGGRHNVGSLHYQGRAIDVRSRGLTEEQIQRIKDFAAAAGISFRDERLRPRGQAVWDKPHIHLSIPGVK